MRSSKQHSAVTSEENPLKWNSISKTENHQQKKMNFEINSLGNYEHHPSMQFDWVHSSNLQSQTRMKRYKNSVIFSIVMNSRF